MTQVPPAGAVQKTNTLALVSLILGIAAVIPCAGIPLGIAAIICGYMARKKIRETGEQGAGMAKAGLILGYCLTILWILAIIAYVVFMVLLVGGAVATLPTTRQ